MAFFPDRPGIVKRVDTLETQVGRLEAVRDDMMGNVERTQYLHAPRHAMGGADPLSPSDVGAADRIHSHVYTDITNMQAMLDAFPGFDLNALAAALAPLIKPHVGGTARKVGEYGAWKMNYALQSNPYVMEGCTPGKLMFVRGISNQNDSFRSRYGVVAYTSLFPSVGGIWTGYGNWYPTGGVGSNAKTKDPAQSNYLTLRANWLNTSPALNRYLGPAIRNGDQRGSDEDGNTQYTPVFGENVWLIHDSTVRVCCSVLTGDDYPVIEFWEY